MFHQSQVGRYPVCEPLKRFLVCGRAAAMAAERLTFPPGDDVEMEVVDGLSGRRAIELRHHNPVRFEGLLDGLRDFLHAFHIGARHPSE